MKGTVIGTGGHVDHGKTALVRALTGVDTDRWKEEKQRGLTIDIGFAPLELGEGGEGGIVDVPGHEDFLKNMLAGATGIDLLLLVVAADEGPMPQTSEHLAIASLLGIERGVVALTKTDRVETAWLELVREAIREELAAAFDGAVEWPIVAVSSLTGEGIEELRSLLGAEAARLHPRPEDDLFRMPVDRSFTVHGTGTVVTGTVWSGRIRTGERMRALPDGRATRVRSLEVHGRPRAEVGPGRRCAIALVGLDPSEVPRGSVVVGGDEWHPVERFGARVRLLPRPARPLRHDQRVRLFHGTRETLARVLLAEGDELAPGSSGFALLRLETPLVPRVGDRFVLRFYSPVTTIGGGRVVDLEPGRRWRRRVSGWSGLVGGSASEAIRAVLASRAGRGALPSELPLLAGLDRGTVVRWIERPPEDVLVLDDRCFAADELVAARALLLRLLSRIHEDRPRAPRVSTESLRSGAAARFAPQLIDRALDDLVARGELVADGPGVRLPDHGPRLTEAERRAMESVYARIAEGGAEPPTVEALARKIDLERDLLNDLLVLLEERERIVALTPEIYVTRETLAELERRARAVLAREGVAPPSAFKETFGVTRKYLIPVLEYLDRAGVTRRTGDGRELAG